MTEKLRWGQLILHVCGECGHERTLQFRSGRSPYLCHRCAARRIQRPWLTKHGATRSPLYHVWCQMRYRCQKAAHPEFPNYGGRGITVCAAWETYVTFAAWAVETGYVKGLFLDRRENDGHYEPGNCRWVTPVVSARNRRNQFTVREVAQIKGLIAEGWPRLQVQAVTGITRRAYFAIKGGEIWVDVLPAIIFAPIEATA